MEEITKFFSYLKHHTDDIVRCGTLTTSFWALQSIGQRVTGAIGLRGTSTSPGISCLGCALTALNLIVANKVLGIVEGRNTVATKDNNKGKIVNQLIDRKDMIYKLTTGLFIYYVTDRTNFRTSFPSSSITLGAFVGPNNLYRRSVPSSSIVATDLQRKRIQELGRKYGCHQCGSKELFKLGFNQKIFIADHMPPSKFIKKLNKVWWRRLLKITVSQRLLPQCRKCYSVQGHAVKHAIPLAIYFYGLRLCHFSPFLSYYVSQNEDLRDSFDPTISYIEKLFSSIHQNVANSKK